VGDRAREAAARLRAAGLGEVLERARRRVEANDGVRGVVVVDAPPDMLAALADLVGWRRLPRGGGPLRLRLADLDGALRRSRFAVGLLEVLAADGGPVVTRRQRREDAAARWDRQLGRIAGAVPAVPAGRWLADAVAGEGPCGRWYRRAYGEDAEAARRTVLAVARALAELPAAGPGQGPGELLAVFAARVTGDPHAFDRNRPAGALLFAALRERDGSPPPELRDSQAWALALARVGLEVDDVSSTVLAAHLEGTGHPVLDAMAAWGGGWPLPLAEVRRLRLAPAPGRPAYAVENPSVFASLVRGLAGSGPRRPPTLLCTGGFLSAAALQLLDALHLAGYRLRYGGDFDRNGLAIADGLVRRYPGLAPWRMGPADYLDAAGGEGRRPLAADDVAWLRGLDGPLAPTGRAMAEHGFPAYQEKLLERLLADLSPEAAAG
jgi:uncharacterized protein (TIGR02679 family)